jgi:hypothetical protein
MLRPTHPGLWILGAIACLGLIAFIVVSTLQRRAEDARLRDATLPRCVERIGDESACRRLLEEGHEDCATYARRWPSRFNRVVPGTNPDTYLECILLTPSGWVAARGRERERQAAERERDLSGH